MEYKADRPYESAKLWLVSFDTRDPVGTLSANGCGCDVIPAAEGKEAVLKLPFIRHCLVKATAIKTAVYCGPAVFPVYCRVQGFTVLLSNVASSLVNTGEDVAINTFVLAQQLLGANYPADDLFADISLLEASAIYAVDAQGLRYVSTALQPVDASRASDALSILYSSFDAIFARGQPTPILLSGGYDSRFNLAIALKLSNKYGNPLSAWHEFKDQTECDLASAVAKKVNVPLHIEDRTSLARSTTKRIFDPSYVRFQSGTYRDNLPRWHEYLRLIQSRVSDSTIIGLGAEAHKGKYYDVLAQLHKAKKVFGVDPARIEIVARSLGVDRFDREYQDRFFEELHAHAAIFPDKASRIDFIHYQTYVYNGYGRRCHDLLQFFGIPFPFLDESFLSTVFSLPPEQKKAFRIVKDGIAELAPQLLGIPFVSGNIKSLHANDFVSRVRDLVYIERLRKLRLLLLPVGRKGRSSLTREEREPILSQKPVSPITTALKRIIMDELDSVPLVRLDYVIQAFLYFRLLEQEKGVSIKCV